MRPQPQSGEGSWAYATTGDAELDAMGTWIWDLSEDRLTCSDEAAAVAGARRGQLDGDMSSFIARFTPSCRSALRAELTAAVQGAQPFRTSLELQRADGAVTLVRISGRPYRDTEGRTVWIVGTLSEDWPDAVADASPVAERGGDPPDPIAGQAAVWPEPHDPRAAVAEYRRVSRLI